MGGPGQIAVAVVEGRFENLNLLASDFSTPDAAQQFLCFATEHGTADQFQPAAGGWVMHGVVECLFSTAVCRSALHGVHRVEPTV